jgi:DNA-binding GntR family transcriptional regulator
MADIDSRANPAMKLSSKSESSEAFPNQPLADGSLQADSRVSVVETVVDAIRNEIKSGRLAPGQRLIEVDIRSALGASRPSIREAMGRLEAEGLVEIEHQRGARVRRLTPVEIENIYQVREALEGVAARLASQNIGKSNYKNRLRALEQEFDAKKDGTPSTYLQYNEQFHRLIVEMSGNSRLIRMVEQLQHAAFLVLIQVVSTRQAADQARADHRPIVTAILKGDGAKAERAMRAHIRRTGRDVAALMEKYPWKT